MIKRVVIVALLLILIGGGLVGFNLFRSKAISDFFANQQPPELPVSTVDVQRSTWEPVINAFGTLGSANGVDLTLESTGIVTEILFSANQKISKGDILLRMDDAVQAADIEAGRTQAKLDAQALARAEQLSTRGVNTQVDLDNASAAAANSEVQVKKLDALLAQKQLRAPFDGTIGIPLIDIGQYLSPGAVVATLQDLDTLHADFTVPQQNLKQLRISQPVTLMLDGQETTLKGKVIGIDPKIDPATRLVSVRVEVENDGAQITPGQFVRIDVSLPPEEGAIAVPNTAVVTSLYGDYVYVVTPVDEAGGTAASANDATGAASDDADVSQSSNEGGPKLEARQVFVSVGRRKGQYAEITDGLEPGDRIVVAGQNRLSNGTPVKIDNSVNLFGSNAGAAAGGDVSEK